VGNFGAARIPWLTAFVGARLKKFGSTCPKAGAGAPGFAMEEVAAISAVTKFKKMVEILGGADPK
jgi:hypothetical protein